MASISIDSDEFFTEESYREYLKKQNAVSNERLRGKNETIFEALASPEADFTRTPDGKLIVETIRGYK